MFSNQKTNGAVARQQKKTEFLRDSAVTILTSGCHFSGKLFCRGSTRIGGRIEGEIVSEGLLIIEDEAVIQANITADEVVIQGKVQGKLEAHNRVELCSSSTYEGDIVTSVLVVKEGAHFNGRSSMKTPNLREESTEGYKSPKIGDLEEADAQEVAMMKAPEITA